MRIRELDRHLHSSSYGSRLSSLEIEFQKFIKRVGGKNDILNTVPMDIRRFLICKERSGKTVIHDIKCKWLGTKGITPCPCRVGISFGTSRTLVGELKSIFASKGMGTSWDPSTMRGNPAADRSVSRHVTALKREQSKAHVVQKQAKPLLLDKLAMVFQYINNQLSSTEANVKEKFVLLRDQAFFKLQFVTGSRAFDLCQQLSQEIRSLPSGRGLVFRQTYGKTASCAQPKTLAVYKCQNNVLCPISGLFDYLRGAKGFGVSLDSGYLFRVVNARGEVLEHPMSYSVVYERLRSYLTLLGLYEGETPHSLRVGCAMTLSRSGVSDMAGVKSYFGWKTEGMAEHYANSKEYNKDPVAQQLARFMGNDSLVSHTEVQEMCNTVYEKLPPMLF